METLLQTLCAFHAKILNQCHGRMKGNNNSKAIWWHRADILSGFPAAFHLLQSLSLYLTALINHSARDWKLCRANQCTVYFETRPLDWSVCGRQTSEVSSAGICLVRTREWLLENLYPEWHQEIITKQWDRGCATSRPVVCFSFWTYLERHADALFVLGGCAASHTGEW